MDFRYPSFKKGGEERKRMTTNQQSTKEKKLCGIRPTGKLHLGHYFSVIKPARQGCDVLVASYHGDVSQSLLLRNELVKYGVKPSQIRLQQEVFDAGLYFRLLQLAKWGELARMTQFKSKEKTPHLFVYPVLMAHDVVGYDEVWVGEDQKQHLEYAKVLLERAGLKAPNPVIVGGRVMSLSDPTKKMSKSEPSGCLFLGEDPTEKVMKAVTTPEGIVNMAWILERLTGEKWDKDNNKQSKELLIKAINET